MSWVELIIVDDDPTIREVLRVLAESLGADVLAEADDGSGAIEQAELYHPQLMLLDVSMPGMGGFSAAKRLLENLPSLRIIFISQHNQKAYADEALQLGAKGYVLKGSAGSELGPAMHAVMDGGTFVSARINR